MRISPGKRRAHQGVATIEILVAVVIVLMVSSLGVLSFGKTDRGAIRAEAAATALFLQQTRMRSIEMGRPVEILLSAEDGTLSAGSQTHLFDTTIDVSPDAARLVLYPSGDSDGLSLDLKKGDHTARVTLNWLTGRVDVE